MLQVRKRVQKSRTPYPDQAAKRRQNWDANSDSPAPESMLSSIPWFGTVDTRQKLIHSLPLFSFSPIALQSLPASTSLRKKKKVSCLVVSESANPCIVAQQAPLSMGFSRQEYWNGLPFPSSGDLSNPAIKSVSPALQADSLPSEPPRKPPLGDWPKPQP